MTAASTQATTFVVGGVALILSAVAIAYWWIFIRSERWIRDLGDLAARGLYDDEARGEAHVRMYAPPLNVRILGWILRHRRTK